VTQSAQNERAAAAGGKEKPSRQIAFDHESGLLFPEKQFRQMLCRERKRSERSRKHLVLMLIDSEVLPKSKSDKIVLAQIAESVSQIVRETDLTGWFEEGSVIGVIFTELGTAEVSVAFNTIESKIKAGLQSVFKPNQLAHLRISFHAFPEASSDQTRGGVVTTMLYPDLVETEKKKKVPLMVKRSMDVVGSTCALLAFSPVFLVLALIVKLTSKGPVFFRQERIGQYGVPFVFLKFRSMHVANNAEIHREFVQNFIAGKSEPASAEKNPKTVYKITNDPRVTWIGKLMRRTSLDELPQFWNVLKGEMSLVGPRPPVQYEFDVYDLWHRRRSLEAKPGITGLWQVHGRSRTTFDEMVRLDLQYSRSWSPLLDLKILLLTPRAILTGDGAY
jgi:lipopolysaccharide/colanic/teichoic acid biosynthesis glycosyltransferase